jgi:hypothetical protein
VLAKLEADGLKPLMIATGLLRPSPKAKGGSEKNNWENNIWFKALENPMSLSLVAIVGFKDVIKLEPMIILKNSHNWKREWFV